MWVIFEERFIKSKIVTGHLTSRHTVFENCFTEQTGAILTGS